MTGFGSPCDFNSEMRTVPPCVMVLVQTMSTVSPAFQVAWIASGPCVFPHGKLAALAKLAGNVMGSLLKSSGGWPAAMRAWGDCVG